MYLQKIFLVAVSIVLVSKQICADYIHEPGRCMIYGECGYNLNLNKPEVRGEMGCVNNREAKKITVRANKDHLDSFKEVCPMMVNADATEAHLCCDEEQLITLQTQLVASELLFVRCPSCSYNFISLYCQTTCSPDQSLFINVTRTFQNPDALLPGSAEQDVIIAETAAAGVHGSCKDVMFRPTNREAINLMCNGFTGDDCTPQEMLNYLGSTANGVSPVDIVFQQIGSGENSIPDPPEGFGVLNFSTPKCNVSPDNISFPCSCTDCDLSCPAPPPTKNPVTPFMIGNAQESGAIGSSLIQRKTDWSESKREKKRQHAMDWKRIHL